ncbi:MAG: hypothetical protein JO048_09665 [Methylobacteriaceae bacterium]|nr:hypothetical protein [Methylobacteriaceae bacterium]
MVHAGESPPGLTLRLVHLGQAAAAERVHNAWLRTIEDGIHPADLYRSVLSRRLVGTEAFADAVIARLGEEPRRPRAVRSAGSATSEALPLARRA